jgi:hypothetical protein
MHEIADRRDRLDQAIAAMAYASEYTPVVRALQCLRGISTLTAFGLAVEIGDWDRFTGSTIGAYLGLFPPSIPQAHPGPKAPSQKPATAMPEGFSSKQPGTTADPTAPRPNSCAPAGKKPLPKHEPAAMPATGAYTNAGSAISNAESAPSSPTSRSPANSLAGAGPWQQEVRQRGKHPSDFRPSEGRKQAGERQVAKGFMQRVELTRDTAMGNPLNGGSRPTS